MKPAAPGLPIAVVEQETGLSKDVLRKWESRYGYPVPDRDEHGDRIYTREQVARLRTIKRLLDAGHRPARLLAMSEAQLSGLDGLPAPGPAECDAAPVAAELLALVREPQPTRLRATLARLLQTQGLERFVRETMAPLSTAVGESWSRGEIRVFEEHLFSDIAFTTLRQALEAIDAPEGRPRVLLTTLPGEVHTLGLLMAACLFTLHGAHCIYLGTETPGEDIAQAAAAHHADLVALSFSSAFPGRRIGPALAALRRMISPNVRILAGGAGTKRQEPHPGVDFVRDLADIDRYIAGRFAA